MGSSTVLRQYKQSTPPLNMLEGVRVVTNVNTLRVAGAHATHLASAEENLFTAQTGGSRRFLALMPRWSSVSSVVKLFADAHLKLGCCFLEGLLQKGTNYRWFARPGSPMVVISRRVSRCETSSENTLFSRQSS